MPLRRSGPKTRKITFDIPGHELEGLTLRADGVTVDEFHEVIALVDDYPRMVELFFDRLIEWDWQDDDGEPVPATRAGAGRLDTADVRTVVLTWWSRILRAHPRPLALAAPSGPEVDLSGLPMVPLPSEPVSVNGSPS